VHTVKKEISAIDLAAHRRNVRLAAAGHGSNPGQGLRPDIGDLFWE